VNIGKLGVKTMRKKNKAEMTITEQITAVREKICDSYCRYTEQYLSCYKDPDEAWEKQCADICNFCPMRELE